MKGYVNSIQSLGTVDGPGVRYVIFLQGCNLKCGCCHNPETRKLNEGHIYEPEELADKAERYREYFNETGGVTLSGGEPLLQAKFGAELFRLLKERNINTCLDTSGCILNDEIKNLLLYTDRVLLDIKYTDEFHYEKYAGCSLKAPLEFLGFLDEMKIPVTIRQVIIPGLNDNFENLKKLAEIIKGYSCVDNYELLPFKKICRVKYEKLGIPFLFDSYDEPTENEMNILNDFLKKALMK